MPAALVRTCQRQRYIPEFSTFMPLMEPRARFSYIVRIAGDGSCDYESASCTLGTVHTEKKRAGRICFDCRRAPVFFADVAALYR
jgi:hypothetical protein